MKSGVIAFGALIWAAPVLAQPQDPLAPLPTSTAPIVSPQPSQSPSTTPALAQPAPAITPSASVPRDLRGVFDAIDAGDWTSARAGIAALPQSILTPVAKAELYTAKGSPVVDKGG